MRRLAIIAVLALTGTHADAQPEAGTVFAQRQADLVALAGHLGGLHRLRQVCHPEEDPDRYRDRLMAIIPVEVPKGSTRLDMIAAFNAGYRAKASEHAICGREARSATSAEAEAALIVTERLYAPFR